MRVCTSKTKSMVEGLSTGNMVTSLTENLSKASVKDLEIISTQMETNIQATSWTVKLRATAHFTLPVETGLKANTQRVRRKASAPTFSAAGTNMKASTPMELSTARASILPKMAKQSRGITTRARSLK